MVKLTKIYTRGGDHGETSLGSGARIKKHALRVAAYGTVDEANSAIGVAQTEVYGDGKPMLCRIQNDLFDLGADLCVPSSANQQRECLKISEDQVLRLESEIDSMNSKLEPLSSFILPGGTIASSYLHFARSIVRRAEREMTELAEVEDVSIEAIRYANRLSDHLFVLARSCNRNGKDDVLWEPGQNLEGVEKG